MFSNTFDIRISTISYAESNGDMLSLLRHYRHYKYDIIFHTTVASMPVASMYSWGGVGQKFPNDEENFRIFHGIRSHEGICYPENEDAIYKQKYT